MEIINETDFEKARKKIKEFLQKKKEIIFSTNDDELSRKILEKEKIDVLLIPLKNREDWQKQRNSGLNQVLAREAKKKGVTIGINLDELIEANKIEKPRILSRIIQNIKIAKKSDLKIKFFCDKHNRDKYDLKSLGLILGITTKNLKEI